MPEVLELNCPRVIAGLRVFTNEKITSSLNKILRIIGSYESSYYSFFD